MIDTKGYTNSGTDGASNFSDEEHDGGDHGDVGVRHRRLGTDLKSDGGESASNTLKELTPHDFGIGRVLRRANGSSNRILCDSFSNRRDSHEQYVQETDSNTGN